MNAILHPTDFSPGSDRIFRLICPMAREQQAKIIVLHVVHSDETSGQIGNGVDVGQDSEWYRHAQEQFTRLRELAGDIPMTLQVKVGPLVDTIVKVAGEQECDLIALAAFQHSYIERQYHGSVSDSLSHVAPCPVLCLKESPFHSQRSTNELFLNEQYTQRQLTEHVAVERQW